MINLCYDASTVNGSPKELKMTQIDKVGLARAITRLENTLRRQKEAVQATEVQLDMFRRELGQPVLISPAEHLERAEKAKK